VISGKCNRDFLFERRRRLSAIGLMSWNDRIRQVRSELGMSQKAFGELVGESQQTIADWETGKTPPKIDDFAKVAEKTGRSAAWLAFGDEDRAGGRRRLDREAMLKIIAAIERRVAAKPGMRLTAEWRADLAVGIHDVVMVPGSDPATIDQRIDEHLDIMLRDRR
jgi:transcriptional regulator with XRE-family HTH domain